MTAKQFIESDDNLLNRSAIAFRMYPENKTAPTHLNKKLSGLRKWNASDEAAAKRVIDELGLLIKSIEFNTRATDSSGNPATAD